MEWESRSAMVLRVTQIWGADVEDENSLVPAMIAVFLGLGGALAGVAIVLITTLVLLWNSIESEPFLKFHLGHVCIDIAWPTRASLLNKVHDSFGGIWLASKPWNQAQLLLKGVSDFGAQIFPRHYPPYIDTVLHEHVTEKPIIIAITMDYANVTN